MVGFAHVVAAIIAFGQPHRAVHALAIREHRSVPEDSLAEARRFNHWFYASDGGAVRGRVRPARFAAGSGVQHTALEWT